MNPDPATPLGQALAAIIATLVAALAEYARENPAFAAPIGIAIRRLNTIAQEFDALAADLIESLNKFKVPEAEQKELLGVVGSTRKDIVETP